ncbi:nucleotidyltransferase substrate binding protein [Candidatus Gottesmanbacteria bacterium]|nr:nucleotidyltransferase substrate binding protein [Candidatus Gottesmanbacteria bacterium]
MKPSALQLEKIHNLHRDLARAVARLKEALALPPTQINQDASIQRFEFSIELAWKLLRAAILYQGGSSIGPRDSVRIGAQMGFIDNPSLWLDLLDARNLTTHVYKLSLAKKVYTQAKSLPPLIDHLLKTVKEKEFMQENLP